MFDDLHSLIFAVVFLSAVFGSFWFFVLQPLTTALGM